jgi:hypothetical protein
VRANAKYRAANLKGIVDDLRSQGIKSIRTLAIELNARSILAQIAKARAKQAPGDADAQLHALAEPYSLYPPVCS